MAKHVIAANKIGSSKLRYFEGYEDSGSTGEVRWASDWKSAKQISTLEIETETRLLEVYCPDLIIQSLRLNES